MANGLGREQSEFLKEGTFLNSVLDGYARIIYHHSYYIGFVSSGLRDGYGTQTYVNSTVLTGRWEKDVLMSDSSGAVSGG